MTAPSAETPLSDGLKGVASLPGSLLADLVLESVARQALGKRRHIVVAGAKIVISESDAAL